MKASELSKILAEDVKENGDRELIIMVDGYQYPVIEVYSNDEYELYLEGYTDY